MNEDAGSAKAAKKPSGAPQAPAEQPGPESATTHADAAHPTDVAASGSDASAPAEPPSPPSDTRPASTSTPWGHRRHRIAVVIALGLVVAGFLIGWFGLKPHAHAASCQVPPAATAHRTGKAEAGHRAPSARAKVDAKVTEFRLGRGVNGGAHSIPFVLDHPVGGSSFLAASATPFSPSTGGPDLLHGRRQGVGTNGDSAIRVWAVLDRDRRHGALYFCINPSQRLSHTSSGQFSGAFVLDDPRVHRLEVPATLDMPYPNWNYVLIVGLATALLGSAYTFYLRRPSLDPELGGTKDLPGSDASDSGTVFRWPFAFFDGWYLFYSDILGALTLAAGLVGATTAYVAQYVASDTWDASTRTWITFIGAIATAFVASATAGKLAQNNYGAHDSSKDPAQAQAQAQAKAKTKAKKGTAKGATTGTTTGTTEAPQQ